MTTTSPSPLSSARRQLLAVARSDVAAAADLEAFRSGVTDLLAAAGRGDDGVISVGTAPRQHAPATSRP